MKRLLVSLFLSLILVTAAQAELRHVELTIFGMD
jgi:hypothetical protein